MGQPAVAVLRARRDMVRYTNRPAVTMELHPETRAAIIHALPIDEVFEMRKLGDEQERVFGIRLIENLDVPPGRVEFKNDRGNKLVIEGVA